MESKTLRAIGRPHRNRPGRTRRVPLWSRLFLALALCAVGLGVETTSAPPADAAPPFPMGIVSMTCQSHAFLPTVCPISGGARGLILKNQLSYSPCIPGHSYFVTSSFIVVSKGCRAIFFASATYGLKTVSCSSWDYAYKACSPFPGVRVAGSLRLDTFSSTACIEGRTWNQTHYGVSVHSGCRGRFLLWYP
jgi:hypothetical protein